MYIKKNCAESSLYLYILILDINHRRKDIRFVMSYASFEVRNFYWLHIFYAQTKHTHCLSLYSVILFFWLILSVRAKRIFFSILLFSMSLLQYAIFVAKPQPSSVGSLNTPSSHNQKYGNHALLLAMNTISLCIFIRLHYQFKLFVIIQYMYSSIRAFGKYSFC